MMATASRDEVLFERAPPMAVQHRLGLVKPDNLNVKRRAVLVVLIAWVPLVVLATLQSLAMRTDEMTSLLWEVGVHARYLIAAPLLIIAEAVCAPQLNHVVQYFIDSGIVDERERGKFESMVASTRRRLASPAAEIATIVLAYLLSLAAMGTHDLDQLPAWAAPIGGMVRYSLAGWWHVLVSLPLLLALIFGWLWRLTLWTWLLWRISRLRLRLLASHPDGCASLSFLGHSVRAFALVGMALMVIVAGRSARMVLDGNGLPTQHLYFNIGTLVMILVLFVGPLFVFTPALLDVWRKGTFGYDALADKLGLAFEHKWIGPGKVGHEGLEKPDFSAVTDLYSIVANVHAMRFVPVDLKDLVVFVVALLLPFVPVVFLAFPLDVIWAHIQSLLL